MSPLFFRRDTCRAQGYHRSPHHEYAGEDPVNNALRRLFEQHKSVEPPLPTSRHLYAEMKSCQNARRNAGHDTDQRCVNGNEWLEIASEPSPCRRWPWPRFPFRLHCHRQGHRAQMKVCVSDAAVLEFAPNSAPMVVFHYLDGRDTSQIGTRPPGRRLCPVPVAERQSRVL